MTEPTQPQSENVVPLKQPGRRAGGVSVARLPAAMHALRDKARQQLQGLLRELFDKADDALFELADQASNNQEQNLYFDSMREVRLRRRAMESEFFEHLDENFAALLQVGAPQREWAEPEEVSVDELTLVQNDELEELVATENMVNKANDQFAEPIQHLTLRMDQLVPVKVYRKNNPLGADAICGGFSKAAKSVKMDVKAKLVLFKLFDRLVVARLGNLYQLLNQQLVEAHILPTLKSGSVPTKSRRQNSASAHTERASREDETNQVLHTLRDLLGASTDGSSASATSGGAGRGGDVLDSRELMQLLSQAQQSNAPQQSLGAPVNVQQLVQQLVSGPRQQNLNQVDDDVINLVSMMFEFILDDRNLAAPMKALLGRLQIPLVKVAIVDKSFFSKGGHPARRLLNELAMAALGWQDAGEEARQKDTFYRQVEFIVQTILCEFETDVGIFERMQLEFRAYQEKERRRAKILEQRTLDAENGKARSERARAEVDAALASVVRGQNLEAAAQKLLHDAWSKVLFITCLKQGVDSEEWQAALLTAEQLVWSVTVTMDRNNRQKLLKMVPELLPKLRSGLESIAYNPYDMTQLFKQLERLHLARLRGQPSSGQAAAPVAEKREQPLAVAEPAPDTVPVEDRAAAPIEQVAAPVENTEPAPESEAAPEVPAGKPEAQPAPASEGADAPTLEPSAAPALDLAAESAPLPASDPHMALVGNLTQGSWFEMQDEAGQAYRCRLAAMIKPTGKYIFVNRSGMKVAEETREGLARALKSGRLRILDDGMLFDRALEAVIGNLRSARAR